MKWFNQLFQRAPQRIPDPLWLASVARLHFLQRLSMDERLRLKDLAETILATKNVSGAGGFVLTDEIAVLIAAQAALPILNLTIDLYDDLHDIIVYPTEFVVPHSEVDAAGVVHEWHEPVAGEALGAGGAIALSWDDVEQGEHPDASFNVLIHEFVHKIDMGRGDANGCPPFLAAYHQELKALEWQSEFSDAFGHFRNAVDTLEEQLPDDIALDDPAAAAKCDALFATLPMDPYAATDPAEFFAVASEAFFIKPVPLAEWYPGIYRLMRLYYRQNPLPNR